MQFEPVFFEHDMILEYEIEDGIQICGDGSRIKQVVDVFLDNACKYAQPQGKTVLTLKRAGHSGPVGHSGRAGHSGHVGHSGPVGHTGYKRCLLEVSNQGEPIDEEDLKNLFKRFYRADKARAMNHSYGLGLSIAQSIVEEHKGRIWAESEDGYNRFFAEFPIKG